MNGIEERLTRLELQVSRLVSDAESEKATRARVNTDMEMRLRHIERNMHIGMGLVIAVQAVLQVLFYVIKEIAK